MKKKQTFSEKCDIICISIIVAYNSIEDIRNNLLALLKQSVKSDKVIIIDNSVEKIRIDMQKMCNDEIFNKLNIEYIANCENKGSAYGFAQGMFVAYMHGAKWIWLHDQDGYPEKKCLEKLLCYSSKYEGIPCILAPLVNDFNGACLRYFRCKNNVFSREYGFYPKDTVSFISKAGTAGVLINRCAIEIVGVYDAENYFVNLEDYDYCNRVRQNGGKILLVKDAIYFHPDLDEKYNNKYSLLKKCVQKYVLPYLPSFLGSVGKSTTYRDDFTAYSRVFINVKYNNIIVLSINILFSIYLLAYRRIFNKNISIKKTLKLYKKIICNKFITNNFLADKESGYK